MLHVGAAQQETRTLLLQVGVIYWYLCDWFLYYFAIFWVPLILFDVTRTWQAVIFTLLPDFVASYEITRHSRKGRSCITTFPAIGFVVQAVP